MTRKSEHPEQPCIELMPARSADDLMAEFKNLDAARKAGHKVIHCMCRRFYVDEGKGCPYCGREYGTD